MRDTSHFADACEGILPQLRVKPELVELRLFMARLEAGNLWRRQCEQEPLLVHEYNWFERAIDEALGNGGGKAFPASTPVYVLRQIAWSYQGQREVLEIPWAWVFTMHVNPRTWERYHLISRTKSALRQPACTMALLYDEFSLPAACEEVDECGYSTAAEQVRVDRIKRLFGSAYRPLLNAWKLDEWGEICELRQV